MHHSYISLNNELGQLVRNGPFPSHLDRSNIPNSGKHRHHKQCIQLQLRDGSALESNTILHCILVLYGLIGLDLLLKKIQGHQN